MMYPFSLGDLRDSSICLMNYMENAPSKIPWEDLKYIFGQIIYGGHIVNDWDRLYVFPFLFSKSLFYHSYDMFVGGKFPEVIQHVLVHTSYFGCHIHHKHWYPLSEWYITFRQLQLSGCG